MDPSRIPKLAGTNHNDARGWLAAMHRNGLLFCLEDNPNEIVRTVDGAPTFTNAECAELEQTVTILFDHLGDVIHELAFEVVSSTFHTASERNKFASVDG